MSICDACDKFYEKTSKYHPNQKYCSVKCHKNAYHRKKRGLSIKILTLICSVCDKQFIQKRANNTQYCSNSCKKLGVFRKFKGLPVKGPRKHIKGSGYITFHGYKIISKKHPNSTKRGQILEHVFIMSQHLGRPLKKHERVHHKNGIRNDNRIENLEIWHHGHPFGQKLEDKIDWSIQFLKEYGYEVIKR